MVYGLTPSIFIYFSEGNERDEGED
jgi:hypothetical protein